MSQYRLREPLTILGVTYQRGDVVDFENGPNPKNLIKLGFVEPIKAPRKKKKK